MDALLGADPESGGTLAGERRDIVPTRAGRAAEENRPMITAIVQYQLPPHIDLASCAAHFRNIAPGFRTVRGLIRKQFIYAEHGWAGGVYLWETRVAAEAF